MVVRFALVIALAACVGCALKSPRTLTAWVESGPAVQVSDITFTGNHSIDEDRLRAVLRTTEESRSAAIRTPE